MPTGIRHSDRRSITLVVDDEAIIRAHLRRVLTADGHEVVEAASAETALLMASDLGPRLGLLLTDVRLGGMDGWTLARAVAASQPTVPICFLSAYPPDTFARNGWLYLQKPIPAEDLLRALRPLRRAVAVA